MQSPEDILARLANWPQMPGTDAPERVWNMEIDRTMSIPGNVSIAGRLTVRGQPVGPLAAEPFAAAQQQTEAAFAELAELRDRVDRLEAALTGEDGNGGRRRKR